MESKRNQSQPDPKAEFSPSPAKRNQIDLMIEMLMACREPVKKTHLIYMAKINHYQLLSYIDMLKRFGMIEEVSAPFNGFVITEKGRTFLKIISSP